VSGGKFPKTKCKICGFKSDIYEVFVLSDKGYICKKCDKITKLK